MKNSILLIGFMGVGKTTVGRILADNLNVPFVDLDMEIEKTAGCSTSHIFANQGEVHFRQLETQSLMALASDRPAVISTGGGIVGFRGNWRLMHQLGTVIYLHADWSAITCRLLDTSQRPLADNGVDDKLQALWQSRLPLYRQADIIIDTNGRNIAQVVAAIAATIDLD